MTPKDSQQHHPSSPTLPEVINEVDSKIAAENIQQREFTRLQSKPTGSTGIVSAISSNRRLTVVVALVVVSAIAVIPLAGSKGGESAKRPTTATSEGVDAEEDVEPIDEVTYTTDDSSSEVSDPTGLGGNNTSSGSGYVASGPSSSKLSKPRGLRIAAGSTQLSVAWAKVPGALQYELQVSRSRSMTSPRQLTSGTNQALVAGLSSSTGYYVRVRAVAVSAQGDWTTPAYAATKKKPTTPVPLPGVTTGVYGKVQSTRSVQLGWSGAANAKQYFVVRATNSSMTSDRKEYAPITSRSYTVADLSPGTVYYFSVKAVNSRGTGPASSPVSLKTHLATPAIASLSLLSNNDIRVKFTASKGATSYLIRYSTNSNFSSSRTRSVAATSVTLTGLKATTKYYVQVRAKDSRFTTAWSKVRAMKTAVEPRLPFTATYSYQNLGRQKVSPVKVFQKIKSSLGGRTNVVYNFGEIDASDPYDEHGALKQVFGTSGWSFFSTDQPQLARLSSDWKSNGTEIVKLLDGGQVFRDHGCATGSQHLMISKYVNRTSSRTRFAVINTHFITHAYGSSGNNAWCRGHWDRSWQKLKDKVGSLHSRSFDVVVAADFNHSSSNFPYLHGGTRLIQKSGPDVIFAIPAKGRGLTVEGKGAISTPTGESFHKNIWAKLKFSGR